MTPFIFILPYFIKNVPIYDTLWIPSSIHHNTLEMDCRGSNDGGPHTTPTRGSQIVEVQLGYGKK
jgi:hypothetical protein